MKLPATVPSEWTRGPWGPWFSAKPSRVVIWLVAALTFSLGLVTLGLVFGINPLVAGGGAGCFITLFQGISFIAHARRETSVPRVEEQDRQ
jgi:hypothetical protein